MSLLTKVLTYSFFFFFFLVCQFVSAALVLSTQQLILEYCD